MSKYKRCNGVIGLGSGSCRVEEIEVGLPQADEVLVKMHAAAICHTDYDSMSWGKAIVMGHEGSGEVTAVGDQVKGLPTGSKVFLNWATPCYRCYQCSLGNTHICEVNSPVVAGGNGYTPGHARIDGTRWQGENIERSFNLGSLSEYALVKQSAVVRFEDPNLSFAAASLLSCGVMTGMGSVINAAQVQAGSSVVVLGVGGVGLNVVQGARIAEAQEVIAIDVAKHRLEKAMEMGATHAILADREDQGLTSAAQKVKAYLGRGADYAFECTAIPELALAPLAMVRNAGVAVQVSGVEQEITADMNLFEWDKVYINPLYGQCDPRRDYPRLLQWYKEGKLMLDELVTKSYALDDIDQAFEDMLAGKLAKGVVLFG